MHRLPILLIAVVFTFASCPVGRAADQKPTVVFWVFATHMGKDTLPHSRVSLQIDKRRVLVAHDLTAQFSVVTPKDYKQHRVPADAVTACTGWWAGQGEDFYAVRRHGHWEVFRRDLDEQASTSAYRRVKSIPGR